jgi:UDP-N-acetylglucosamine 2-epimerase (non-hydrolysing)
VPCFTLRKTTEHPITVEQRTNTMVGRDTEAMRRNADAILARHGKEGHIPEMWDGHAAERITRDLGKSLLDQHQVKKSA